MNQWRAALKSASAETAAAQRAFLKAQGLGMATISLILDDLAGKTLDSYDPQALVSNLFKGPKAALLPLYESVLQFALEIGNDVKACPCATMVPLYRNHVFAQLKPSTRSRLDLGLALGNLQSSPNKTSKTATTLIDTGGFAKKDRITHRLELETPSDFNEFAKDWLVRAYKADQHA